MKKLFTVMFFIIISIQMYATVIIKSHTQTVEGVVTLHIYANTAYGEGVAAQARYGSPYSYTGFVAGVYNERGSGDSYTNYDVTISGLPSSGYADFEACKLATYGDVNSNKDEYTGFVYTISNLIPVELTTFSALVTGNNVKLNWETATEVNNYGFEIERKSVNVTQIAGNLSNWEKIGFVEGHGNSNSPKAYTYSDNLNTSGKYLYRLKQIDIDGSFEYTEAIEIFIEAPKAIKLGQNYPNPFNPVTVIQFSLPEETNVKLVVYNAIGEKILQLIDEKISAGLHQLSFDGSKLNSGIYFYQLETENFVQTRKMLLIK